MHPHTRRTHLARARGPSAQALALDQRHREVLLQQLLGHVQAHDACAKITQIELVLDIAARPALRINLHAEVRVSADLGNAARAGNPCRLVGLGAQATYLLPR